MSKSIGFLMATLLIALNLKAESERNNKPEPTTFQLTVIVVGYRGSSETISSSPEGIHCGSYCTASFEARTSVTLSAIIDESYKFKGWGNEDPVSQTLTIFMDTTKIVTVYYDFWDDDNDGFPHDSDCNDSDDRVSRIFSQVYIDVDGDGYDGGKINFVCYQGAPQHVRYILTSEGKDCDDNDGSVWEFTELYIDADGDGYAGQADSLCFGDSIPAGYSLKKKGLDCNDNDPNVWNGEEFYIDNDGDGYSPGSEYVCFGAKIPSGYSYSFYSGYSPLGFDCNDKNPSIYEPVRWYLDQDSDGHGISSEWSCVSPGFGYTTKYIPEGDCNDMDSSIFVKNRYFSDLDHDGYGSVNSIYLCSNILPIGYSVITGDCDDSNSAIHLEKKYFQDYDGDGFGDSRNSKFFCTLKAPESFVIDSSDCNDLKRMYADLDGDGFGTNILAACNGVSNKKDCNDNDPLIHENCLEESLYISRDSVLPPTDPTIIITHGLININIQTMQEVDIKVRDTDIYQREVKSDHNYDSQTNRKIYQPIDSAHLTITIPFSWNINDNQSIKIEIFNNSRIQNNTLLAAREEDQ